MLKDLLDDVRQSLRGNCPRNLLDIHPAPPCPVAESKDLLNIFRHFVWRLIVKFVMKVIFSFVSSRVTAKCLCRRQRIHVFPRVCIDEMSALVYPTHLAGVRVVQFAETLISLFFCWRQEHCSCRHPRQD